MGKVTVIIQSEDKSTTVLYEEVKNFADNARIDSWTPN